MPDPLDIFVDGHHVRYKAYAPAKGRSARQFKFCLDWDVEQKPEDAWTRFNSSDDPLTACALELEKNSIGYIEQVCSRPLYHRRDPAAHDSLPLAHAHARTHARVTNVTISSVPLHLLGAGLCGRSQGRSTAPY